MGPDFNSKIAAIRHRGHFEQLSDGTYIIPTGEKEGVNNVLIFTDGKMSDPSISQVIKIELDNETELAPIRAEFIEYLEWGMKYEHIVEILENHAGQKLFYKYEMGDFANHRENSKTSGIGRNSNRNNQQFQNRTGSAEKNSSTVQNDINQEQYQVRNTMQGLGVVTRRDVIALLDKHSESLSRSEQIKLQNSLKDYRIAVDVYSEAVEYYPNAHLLRKHAHNQLIDKSMCKKDGSLILTPAFCYINFVETFA